MKTIYNLLILGMLYLISNTTYAQIVQYSDDGTKSCIDCEEKNSSTERSCLCTGPFQLRIFNNEIAAVNTEKDKWLYEQELLLAAAITGINYYAQYHSPTGLSPDYNFQNIQGEYFKEVETNRMADGYIGRANDYLKNKFNFDDTKFESSSLNYAVLDIRKRTGTGINIPYGDLKYEGQYLRNMSDASINSLLYEQYNIRSRQRSSLLNFEKSQSKIERYHLEGRISEGLANRYINHYNSLGYEDAIRFMTRYMVWINNQHLPIPYRPFGNPNNIFVLEDHDYTLQLVETADLGQPMENFSPTVFNETPDDVGLFNYAVNSLGTSAASFLKNSANQGVKKATKSYLENQQYNANGLKLSQDIFKSYANNTPFPHNQYDYSLATGQLFSINFQDEQNKNRLFHMENHNSGNSRQFNGLGNLLSSIAQPSDRNEAFIGDFVIEILKDNGTDMSATFNGQQAFDLFHFRTFKYYNFGRYELGVDFNEFRGTTIWDNDIRYPSFLENPIEINAILVHEANDLPRFEYLLKLRDFANTLQLNQKQKSWLVDNRNKAENLYNYYSILNSAGTWSSEEVKFTTNAINVLMANPNANPLIGADCRSFEFAQPPGALQRGCAVKNFDHTFYTAGVRSNGSPYYGEIDVNIPIIYFTAPTWMTNGRAANVTAAAVTGAIKAADVYFFENPDASEFTVADVFRDALRDLLVPYGGGFSTTAEPFVIPSPAPYMTSVMGISNPYDCE